MLHPRCFASEHHVYRGPIMSFFKVLILFLGSTRIGFHAWMFKKHIIFLIFSIVAAPLFQSVSNALLSSCVYEAPPSEKHNVLWLVGWTIVLRLVKHFECVWEMSRSLNQAPHLYLAYALGGNYINEEYCDMFVPGRKLKTTMKAFQGVQKHWHWYREELLLEGLFHAQTATLHTKERWTCKKAE